MTPRWGRDHLCWLPLISKETTYVHHAQQASSSVRTAEIIHILRGWIQHLERMVPFAGDALEPFYEYKQILGTINAGIVSRSLGIKN
jgi:hypothetical protein